MEQGNYKGIYRNTLRTKCYTILQILFLMILDSLWQGFYDHNRSYKSFFKEKSFQKLLNT